MMRKKLSLLLILLFLFSFVAPAALAAEGESVIEQICHIERGYESIENAFSKLSAKIKKE